MARTESRKAGASAAPAAPVVELPRNPHCAPPWPVGYFDHIPEPFRYPIVELRRDVLAIMVLADLLHADELIADDVRDSDNPAGESQPFTACTRSGLLFALDVCAGAANDWLERLEDA